MPDTKLRPTKIHRRYSGGRECLLCRQRHLSNTVCFRLPIPKPNPNPNHITDPNPNLNPNRNPKNNKKENDTGMKLNIELYLNVDFPGTGLGI